MGRAQLESAIFTTGKLPEMPRTDFHCDAIDKGANLGAAITSLSSIGRGWRLLQWIVDDEAAP